jgi:hypothetical protein
LGLFAAKSVRFLTVTPGVIDQQDFVNVSVSVEVDPPCFFLHLDALDAIGLFYADLNSTANLRRFTRNGGFIASVDKTVRKTRDLCYGAVPDDARCSSVK